MEKIKWILMAIYMMIAIFVSTGGFMVIFGIMERIAIAMVFYAVGALIGILAGYWFGKECDYGE